MKIRNQEKQNEYARKHYLKNRQAQIDRVKANKPLIIARNQAFIREYLTNNPCVDCGEKNLIVLEFDHVRGDKKFNVADMSHKQCSLQRIKDEIAKCEVRCANCHRIKTYERAGSTHRT